MKYAYNILSNPKGIESCFISFIGVPGNTNESHTSIDVSMYKCMSNVLLYVEHTLLYQSCIPFSPYHRNLKFCTCMHNMWPTERKLTIFTKKFPIKVHWSVMVNYARASKKIHTLWSLWYQTKHCLNQQKLDITGLPCS